VPFWILEDSNCSGTNGLSDLEQSGLQDGANRAAGPGEKAKGPVEVKVRPTGSHVEDANDPAAGAKKWRADVGVNPFFLYARSQVTKVRGEIASQDRLPTAQHQSGKALAGMKAGDLRKGGSKGASIGGEEHVSALRFHQEQF
jgi:hypothetical protein